jgi:hypothetical protein
MSQPKPTRADAVDAIIARHQAIRALIDQEDDEDKVARLADAEDHLMHKLARRREPGDAAFFAKTAYLLAARAAEAGEPTLHDPFGAVAIAVRRHLELNAKRARQAGR